MSYALCADGLLAPPSLGSSKWGSFGPRTRRGHGLSELRLQDHRRPDGFRDAGIDKSGSLLVLG